MLWTLLCEFVGEHMSMLLLGMYLGMRLSIIEYAYIQTQFTFLRAVFESSNYSTSVSTLNFFLAFSFDSLHTGGKKCQQTEIDYWNFEKLRLFKQNKKGLLKVAMPI